MSTTRITVSFMAALLCLPLALADEGHSHDAPATASAAPALPRFAASSAHFELVGVAHGRQLTVYLDRFADNAPAANARLELAVGGTPLQMEEHRAGEFEATMASELKPGTTPFSATVVTDAKRDVLSGEIEVHADELPHADDHATGRSTLYGALALAALVLAGAAIWLARRGAVRRVSVGGAT